jgi:hypothetical protein
MEYRCHEVPSGSMDHQQIEHQMVIITKTDYFIIIYIYLIFFIVGQIQVQAL